MTRARLAPWLLGALACLALVPACVARSHGPARAHARGAVSGGSVAGGARGPAPRAVTAALPRVGHVFVIVLENESAASTFGPGTKAPYLARTLTAQGQFLPNYYGITHNSLGNYIALISGQGSNVITQADCPLYENVTPGTIGADGQALGQGCVYPRTVDTVAGQLSARGLGWKGYEEDMGNDPAREARMCGHPALGSIDRTQSAKVGDQYAARHNPFVYFHSIIDTPACAANDVRLDELPAALHSVATTPAYSFITPNLCDDGHDSPCVDGRPGGLVSADAFLRHWVPMILASPAYRRDGLLLVTFDEASTSDSSACCGEPQFPNTPSNGATTRGLGGGRVGAVVLSPFTQPGSVNPTPYNHFSFLRTVEDLFGLSHLGYAGRAGLRAFGSDVFNAAPASRPRAGRRHVRRPSRHRRTHRGHRPARRVAPRFTG